MATFYIQLENRLLQISGELTTENISKALGYVPVSPNVTNELSQRIDNITFDSLKDNPFLQDGSGELNIVDDAGNIIAKIDAEGIHSVDFIAGVHRLTDKADKTYIDEAVKNVTVDLTGYATEEYVNNIDFYNINNNPIVNNGDGKLLFVDENGYIGLQLEEDGLYVKDVIADGHTLSQKADKSDIPSLDGYAKTEELPDFNEFAKTSDIPSLDDYATKEWINNNNYATEYDLKTIDYSSIKNTPTVEDETGELNITDENGNIGMKVSSEAVYAKDFIASEHKLSEKVNKDYVDNSIAELVDGAPETLNTLNEISAALKDNADIVDVLNQSISSKQDIISDIETIRQGAAKGATSVQQGTLSTVATSGSYNDLTNKPTIPAVVTESTISDWGFTKNVGTITGVSANGTSIATSGVANIPAASTSKYGVTKLSSSTSSTSTSLAATASAVKSAYDLANGKQDKLTSGTNIKTINGQSLLGSGNITISGGSNTESSAAYGLVEHGTSDTTFTLTSNTFHVWDEVDSLTLTLDEETAGVANEYLFLFNSGDLATILTLPGSIKWSNGIPIINSNKTYLVSILKKFATLLEFEYTKLITFTVLTGGYGTKGDTTDPVTLLAEAGMTWIDWVNSEYNNGDFSIRGLYLIYYDWYDIENLDGDIVDVHSVIDLDVYLFANYN